MSKKYEDFFSIWFIVVLINQIFIFHACFYPHCIIAALPHTALVTFLLLYFFGEEKKDFSTKKNEDIDIQVTRGQNELEKLLKELQNLEPSVEQEIDPLKARGDEFEKYIGKKFEDKGELVIYNGFIRGSKDKGVDIISICSKRKSINLIQCKNWTRKSMFLEDIENIYTKLSLYDFDFYNLSSTEINQYLQLKKDNYSIQTILEEANKDLEKYTIRKTLYVSSDKVMDLRIGEKLIIVKPNIYRYEDMKIVVREPLATFRVK